MTDQETADKFAAALVTAATGLSADLVLGVLLSFAASFRTQITRAALMGLFHNALAQVEQSLPPIPQAPAAPPADPAPTVN